MIEVEVHQQLRQLQRQQQGDRLNARTLWPHQLTMARLVARGLRLQRHALIQVPPGGHHRLSYLLPALMWPGPTAICAPADVRAELLHDLLPYLQSALDLPKPARECDRLVPGFDGLMLLDPEEWLRDRLTSNSSPGSTSVPLVLDGAEHLELWTQHLLSVSISSQHWHQLRLAVPQQAEAIERIHIQLFQALARRPLPSFLLHADERAILDPLLSHLNPPNLPQPWLQWQHLHARPDAIAWVDRNLETGQFTLHLAPADKSGLLAARVWSTQPVVAIGEALDATKEAAYFRQRLGLPNGTVLRFLPDRRDEAIRVCTPAKFPAPHSPLFRDRAIASLRHLLCDVRGPALVLVSDRPLQSQIGTALAAEFGSRVRVNDAFQSSNGIGVCSWDYWLTHQSQLPVPTVAIAVTLPFPSMEDPWVAGQVAHFKRQRQDWFRTYLLPSALSTLQRAIGSLRQANGILVLLDSRVTTRSYGEQFLECLNPALAISERQVRAALTDIEPVSESWRSPVTDFPDI